MVRSNSPESTAPPTEAGLLRRTFGGGSFDLKEDEVRRFGALCTPFLLPPPVAIFCVLSSLGEII